MSMSINVRTEKAILEIANMLEFLIRHKVLGSRTVPEEGGPSWDEQEEEVDTAIERIKKTGNFYKS